jgi:hypothetical protein
MGGLSVAPSLQADRVTLYVTKDPTLEINISDLDTL